MSKYQYSPLDSAGFQIRLLTIPFEIAPALGNRARRPLHGKLSTHYLPSTQLSRLSRLRRSARLPVFYALSYVWGRSGARPREILIDGKGALSITANLHAAIRDLQRGMLGVDIMLWADAICINQEDAVERSAQIRLMRDIYHLAATVKVWLGPRTEETVKCSLFIGLLAGETVQEPSKNEDRESSMVAEAVTTAFLVPAGRFVKAGFGFGQALTNLGEIITSDARDDKATMILDPDSEFSLHQQTIKKLVSWRPSDRHLERAQGDGNFTEMALLVDRVMLQKSEWFERMWVVQEVGVADYVSLQYGESSLLWSNFLKVIYYLHYTCQIPMENAGKVTRLEKIRLGYNAGERQPLRDLLWDTRYRRATDPRDKIYSLLGLMGDPMSQLLRPDYNKPVSEVYSNATHHLVAQNSSLDPICGQQVQGRRGDLPTWVPDYSLNRDLAASPLVRIDGRESIYAASGYDYHARFLIPEIYTLPKSWDSLPVTGLLIDTLSHASDPPSDDDSIASIKSQWLSTLLAARDSMQGFTDEISAGLMAIASTIERYSELISTTHTKPDISTAVDSSSIPPESYIVNAYIHSLLCGRISPSERLTREDVEALITFQAHPSSSIMTPNDFIKKVCKALEAGMRRRRLAVTKDGYIGAVPREARIDDIVCVLFGCSVPVVLRELGVDDGSVDSAGTSYRFIGECYLHGFMDAEAIPMLVRGTREARDFLLK